MRFSILSLLMLLFFLPNAATAVRQQLGEGAETGGNARFRANGYNAHLRTASDTRSQ